MCNKIVLDEITAQVALEARRQLGDKLDSVILCALTTLTSL